MSVQEEIYKIAKAEVGTTEKPANSNKTKYGEAYGWNGVSWCVIFQWYIFQKANASSLFYGGKKTASCSALISYAKSHGQWVTSNYQLGDLCFMEFTGDNKPDHVGFVVSQQGNTLNTIEGNTSFDDKGSQSNGGAVAEKKRPLSCIVGAYRPNYPTIKKESVIAVTARQLQKGNTGDSVKVLQSALNALQGSNLKVDGDFGAATETAVKKYQQAHIKECGSADGICGKKTWISILT